MSDSQTYEEVTATADGVTVTKRFEEDEFPVPAIAFNVSSSRTEAVTVRLVDTVPEDVAVEDLGFHPEYGSEYWDIDDDQITFEREIEPEADYTTVYGIRATGTDDVEKFLTEPVLEEVDPPLDESEEDLVGGSDNAVKDVIAGDTDSIPGLEDDDDDDDIETLNLKDPNAEGGDGEVAETDGDEGESTVEEAANVEGNLVAAMADEIRANNVSASDVKLLKRALDAVSDDSGTANASGVNEARIQRIQQDISDLRAYTDALEEFLADNGTGDQMIAEFSEQLDAFESQLGSFEDDIQSAKATAEEASNDVEEVHETVDTVEDEVDEIGGSVDEVQDGLGDVRGNLDELEGQIEGLESQIGELRDEIGDGEVDERLSELEGQIDDLQQWRDQLSSIMGGGGE